MVKNPVKLLIVDDNEDDYIIIHDFLSEIRGTKYIIEWASNFGAAAECIRMKRYDVFLFDYHLGEKDGIELVSEVVKNNSPTPIIMLTSWDDYNVDILAMKTGACDFLLKSEITPSLLERSIRYAIRQKKTEEELFHEKEHAVVTLESIGDAVITTDDNGIITNMNRVAEKLIGLSKDEAAGLYFPAAVCIIDEIFHNQIDISIDMIIKQRKFYKFPAHSILISREGSEFSIEGTVSPIYNRKNAAIGVVIVIHDVTDNRELIKRISFQASHDALTGIANRFSFEEQLKQLIDNVSSNGRQHVFLYIDLDHFKIINDTCGHFAGDQLLKQIASLIERSIRHTDIIARLGGDEFGILLKDATLPEACCVASKICSIINEFRFDWNSRTFTVSASIGIVGIDKNLKNIDKILIAADQSCYIAKEKGRGRYYLYKDNDHEFMERHGEMHLVLKIRNSLEENRFCLHFQPIVPMSQKNPFDWYEILVRMNDKEGGIMYPNSFIPAMERYNMMLSLDRWVINEFFSQWSRIFEENNNMMFNINISGTSLNNTHFFQFMKEKFRNSGILPENICFEITETIAIDNFKETIKFIHDLKTLGCRFALDDFGSGLSSLNYLKYLPVDYLKIDGSFIKNIAVNPVDCTMVTAINEIAHYMGIKTIAEFVESEDIFNKLADIGIDYAQGYWIGKPGPIYNTVYS